MKKIIATATVQQSRGLYLNLPKKIVNAMDIEKGETAVFEMIDKDTLQIKFIED